MSVKPEHLLMSITPEERCFRLEERVRFLQSELEDVSLKLVHAQSQCIQAQEIAMDRGWLLVEARKKLLEAGIK